MVLGYGGLIWDRSDSLLWRSGLVWWSDMEVCLRKMVWSECWKLKRWEAELIVVNGSIRAKRDSCIRKVEEKNSHSFKTRITHSFLSRIPCPPRPSRLLFSRAPTPYPPHKLLCTFSLRSQCKTLFILFLLSTFIFKSLSVYSHYIRIVLSLSSTFIKYRVKRILNILCLQFSYFRSCFNKDFIRERSVQVVPMLM